MLVFDTETRTDATQRLTFGSYRFISDGRCLEEGLFYADDLPPKDRAVLQRYVRRHRADVHKSGARDLKLLEQPAWKNPWLAEMFCDWLQGGPGHPAKLDDNDKRTVRRCTLLPADHREQERR